MIELLIIVATDLSSSPEQHGHHFADAILKYIFVNINSCISINISQKFVPKGEVNNIPALVRIMARRQAIIWTNTDPVHLRIYATPGGDELIIIREQHVRRL